MKLSHIFERCSKTDHDYDGFEATIDGEKYVVEINDVSDEDTRRSSVSVRLPNGKKVSVDWSTMSVFKKSDLELWVRAGMPTRKDLGLTTPIRTADLKKGPKSLRESFNFGAMQKIVYDYTLSKLKSDKAIVDYAKDIAKTTDEFWVETFDEVDAAFKTGSKDKIFDALSWAIEDVGVKISNYFKNPANHPPGYKVPKKIEYIGFDDVPAADLFDIVEKIDPELAVELKPKKSSKKK